MSRQGAAMGEVIAVCRSDRHEFSKTCATSIRLLAGLGVEGDAHLGEKVQHRSRVARDPEQPNLRQVHLLHAELHQELLRRGYAIRPGEMGENITTRGIDLLGLPADTRLRLGPEAIVIVTGLRNPCRQLDDFRPGLTEATLERGEKGELIRKAGVMAVVVTSGQVCPGDTVTVELPPPPHRPLRPV